jgi:hypothetical protein
MKGETTSFETRARHFSRLFGRVDEAQHYGERVGLGIGALRLAAIGVKVLALIGMELVTQTETLDYRLKVLNEEGQDGPDSARTERPDIPPARRAPDTR